MEKLKFKSSPISIFDNTFKISWLATIVIITNFAIIVSKINEFNEKINISLNIGPNVLIIILLVMFIIVVFIYYTVKWYIFKIELENNKIIVHKNIVIKDRYVFLLKNISGYVIEQNILDKIFNVYKFKIYTERIHNLREDVTFIVKRNLAQKINDKILAKITYYDKSNITLDKILDYDIKVKLKEIIRHSLFNLSIKNSFIILNVILLIFAMIRDGTIVKEVMGNLLGFLITIFTIILPILYSLFTSILKFYGYSIKKNEDWIMVKYGFFTTKKCLIPINKIKGFILKETLISRIFNYNMLQVICSGISNKKGELNFLFPMINRKKLTEVLKFILPGFEFKFDNKFEKQDSFSIIIFVLIITLFSIIFISILMFIRVNGIYIFGYLIVSLVSILFFYFYKKIKIEDKYIIVSTGIFIKKISVILYNNIKYIKITKGIISNLFNINKINIYITSNFENIRHSLGYVSNDSGFKVKEKYLKQNIY